MAKKASALKPSNAKARSAKKSGNTVTKKVNNKDEFETARMMKITASDRRSGLVVRNDNDHVSENK